MTGIAASGVFIRKTRVVEQAIAERYLPRILDLGRRDRRDRLWGGARLRRRRLRNRRPCGAKGQNDQDQTRYATSGCGDDHRQSQAVARGRHGQFTIQCPPAGGGARQATALVDDDPALQIMILDFIAVTGSASVRPRPSPAVRPRLSPAWAKRSSSACASAISRISAAGEKPSSAGASTSYASKNGRSTGGASRAGARRAIGNCARLAASRRRWRSETLPESTPCPRNHA